MKQPVATLALVPAFLALSPQAERLTFGPEIGTVLEKEFSFETSLVLDNMDMLLDGEPLPVPVDMEMSGNANVEFSVTDIYSELEGDRLLKLTRTLDSLSVSNESVLSGSALGEQVSQANGESELTGKTVVFSREQDSDQVAVEFAEGSDGAEALLEDLHIEFDFRDLLPGDAVEVGSVWEVEPGDLIDVLAPCGDLKISLSIDGQATGLTPGADPSTDLRSVLGEIEGSVEATFTGLREEGDRQFAVIALAVDVEATKDLTEETRAAMSSVGEGLPEGSNVEVQSFDSELTLEGEGELLWDVAGGHFRSFKLDVEMTSTIDAANSIGNGGPRSLQEMNIETSGSMVFQAEARRP